LSMGRRREGRDGRGRLHDQNIVDDDSRALLQRLPRWQGGPLDGKKLAVVHEWDSAMG
jgi:hypothetical protein